MYGFSLVGGSLLSNSPEKIEIGRFFIHLYYTDTLGAKIQIIDKNLFYFLLWKFKLDIFGVKIQIFHKSTIIVLVCENSNETFLTFFKQCAFSHRWQTYFPSGTWLCLESLFRHKVPNHQNWLCKWFLSRETCTWKTQVGHHKR